MEGMRTTTVVALFSSFKREVADIKSLEREIRDFKNSWRNTQKLGHDHPHVIMCVGEGFLKSGSAMKSASSLFKPFSFFELLFDSDIPSLTLMSRVLSRVSWGHPDMV